MEMMRVEVPASPPFPETDQPKKEAETTVARSTDDGGGGCDGSDDATKSWAYREWRTFFKSPPPSQREAASLNDNNSVDAVPPPTFDPGNEEHNSSEKAETDSEMTLSSTGEKNVPITNADDGNNNSLQQLPANKNPPVTTWVNDEIRHASMKNQLPFTSQLNGQSGAAGSSTGASGDIVAHCTGAAREQTASPLLEGMERLRISAQKPGEGISASEEANLSNQATGEMSIIMEADTPTNKCTVAEPAPTGNATSVQGDDKGKNNSDAIAITSTNRSTTPEDPPCNSGVAEGQTIKNVSTDNSTPLRVQEVVEHTGNIQTLNRDAGEVKGRCDSLGSATKETGLNWQKIHDAMHRRKRLSGGCLWAPAQARKTSTPAKPIAITDIIDLTAEEEEKSPPVPVVGVLEDRDGTAKQMASPVVKPPSKISAMPTTIAESSKTHPCVSVPAPTDETAKSRPGAAVQLQVNTASDVPSEPEMKAPPATVQTNAEPSLDTPSIVATTMLPATLEQSVSSAKAGFPLITLSMSSSSASAHTKTTLNDSSPSNPRIVNPQEENVTGSGSNDLNCLAETPIMDPNHNNPESSQNDTASLEPSIAATKTITNAEREGTKDFTRPTPASGTRACVEPSSSHKRDVQDKDATLDKTDANDGVIQKIWKSTTLMLTAKAGSPSRTQKATSPPSSGQTTASAETGLGSRVTKRRGSPSATSKEILGTGKTGSGLRGTFEDVDYDFSYASNRAVPNVMDTTSFILARLGKGRSRKSPHSIKEGSNQKYRKRRSSLSSELKEPPKDTATARDSPGARELLSIPDPRDSASASKKTSVGDEIATKICSKQKAFVYRRDLLKSAPRLLEAKKILTKPNLFQTLFARNPFDASSDGTTSIHKSDDASKDSALNTAPTQKGLLDTHASEVSASAGKRPPEASLKTKAPSPIRGTPGSLPRKRLLEQEAPFTQKKPRHPLMYSTCRSKTGKDTAEIHRTIPLREENYFCVQSNKVLFEFSIWSMETAVMIGEFKFGIKISTETNLAEIREKITILLGSYLNSGALWEFFLVDAGIYIKRELESLIPLREYMDESGNGAKISIRVVREHSPAIIMYEGESRLARDTLRV